MKTDPGLFILGIAVIVLALTLGIAHLVLWLRSRRPRRCACLEFAGDNPACPIPAHSHVARALERDDQLQRRMRSARGRAVVK